MSDTSLVQQLTKHLDDNKITQAALSRALGISTASVNLYLRGEYQADVTNIEKKIASYLSIAAEKKEAKIYKPQFIQTFIASRILDAARFAHMEQEIALVIGDAGLGKTTAIKQYAQEHPGVILIEADPGFGASSVLEEILLKLGGETGRHIHPMMLEVISKLKDTGRMIMIDEAENLPYRALEVLRRIYDKTGVGLLLCGMPRLLSNLRGKRGEFAQLYSRVGRVTNINNIRAEMPDAVQADTEMMVNAYLPGSNGYWKDFHVHSKGNPRVLFKLIRRSARIMEVNQTRLNPDVVQTAAEMLLM